MTDLFNFWENGMRSKHDGMHCAGNYFAKNASCTTTDRYSSAGLGMALIAECVFAELGYLSKEKARTNVMQTLETLQNS